MNTSLCTRGTPGKTLPSSAISAKPAGGSAGATAVPVCDPTIAGTCMRRPALTRRTSTVPVIPVVTGTTGGVLVVPAEAANTEAAALVLSNARPVTRQYNGA